MMKATPESPRMFESDIVDFFSRTHPAVVPILFVPASGWLLWQSVSYAQLSVGITVSLFAAGAIGWTLSEYWLHRLFFHWQPGGKWGERMHFLVHGVHHTWPRDKYRLVMPPAVSITLFFAFLGLFYLLLGTTYMWAVHAGYVFGYMVYDMTHYYIHHFNPMTEYGRRLKKHHMLHHFKDPTNRFGVSAMVWDHVFGTYKTADKPRRDREAQHAAAVAGGASLSDQVSR
jgi:sterol desaturase/sphingolipid hydroxylase (fatty acid hydroxylase superfamily)